MSHSSFIEKENIHIPKKRNIKKVPFVELFHGRLQGVVSSGSDIKRVYVSFFEAGTHDFYCSTNNNRPCGGLGGYPCGKKVTTGAIFTGESAAAIIKKPPYLSSCSFLREFNITINRLRQTPFS